jgi:predicted lipid-binding transport protein (Tim44 family)
MVSNRPLEMVCDRRNERVKKLLFSLAAAVALAGLGLAPEPADAKRLGGGRPAGMQRQMPPKQADAPPASPAPNAAPQNTAAAAPIAGAAPAAAAQAAGKRSWLGPVAGLAAGLGLAALASHLGFGEGLANLMTVLLVAMVGFMLLRWLMRRMAGAPASARAGGLQLAGAGGPAGPMPAPMQRTASAAAPMAGAAPAGMPEGFDAQAFERIAKMIFIRLQAANDAGNVDDLRKFTTPELFASLRLDLQERGAAAQQTDVVDLACDVVDTAQQDGQWIASVRFHGLIREQAQAPAEPFDELWHLVRPVDGSRDWAIAGIQPAA